MNSPSRHNSDPRRSQHDSAPIKERFEIPADELDAAALFAGTIQSALSRVRTAVESDIVVDESNRGARFQRRYENARAKINDTEVTFTELAWSQFNDPYKTVTLTAGDTALSLSQGEDMNVGSIRTAVSMSKRTAESEGELQWSLEIDGPYRHGAWLMSERQPGELGGTEASADEQLEAGALIISETLDQLLPEEHAL